MDKLFSTMDVHPRDRFDYWHDVACRNIAGHSSKPASKQNFEAQIEGGSIADMGLVLFENSPMTVTRTALHIAQSESDSLFVCQQVRGSVAIEQNGRQVILQAGDVTLVDPLLPYFARFSGVSKLLVLKVPRADLRARLGQTREMVAIPISACEPRFGSTSSFVAMLPGIAGSIPCAAEEIARDQALDVIAWSLLNAVGLSKPRVSSARSLALLNVRTAIESRLCNPALDPRTVAEAAGISVRYANALLGEQSNSITRLIRTRRLVRCRIALEDPLQGHRTISDIAYGWGFSDMTHFGRSFKAMYGVSPQHYRSLHKSPRSGAQR
jgi:AraC family transcriptional activator of tynA and feaB